MVRLRERFRSSFLRRHPIIEVSDHSVLCRPLGKASVVLDLGANHGRFSAAIKEKFGCQCYAVEANPSLVAGLKTRGYSDVLHAAAAGTCGGLYFSVSACDLQSRIFPEEGVVGSDAIVVPGMSYSATMRHFRLSRVDLLKLDIEGAELALIDAMTDLELAGIQQVTVEFHDFINIYPRAEVMRILRRMSTLGFINLSPNFGTYDVLLVNRRLVPGLRYRDALFASIVTRPLLRALRPSRSQAS